jgi:hypothetical protein
MLEWGESMKFLFVKDYNSTYRFFSSVPVEDIHIEFSRWKKIWKEAKTKLMLLPIRLLSQEQAFEKVLKIDASELEIFHSGLRSERRIRTTFFFFIQRQRSKHLFLLIGETLLLPISGLMALLPGPNVFFGFLALIMYTHWMGMKGVNRLARLEHRFTPHEILKSWESAVTEGREEDFPGILSVAAREFDRKNITKILWK